MYGPGVGKSSIKQQIGVNVGNDLHAILVLRANARGLSLSRYAGLILGDWQARGCPALDAVDSTARAIVKQQIDAEGPADWSLNEDDPAERVAEQINRNVLGVQAREQAERVASIHKGAGLRKRRAS